MIDIDALRAFEKAFSAVVDTLELLKRLEPPVESEGAMGIARWHRDFHQILLMLATIPDTTGLTHFAEELEAALADVAEGGQGPPEPPGYPKDDGMLPIYMPPGDVTNDILYWDATAGKWAILDAPDTDYKVLQRKADGTLGFDYVRAH